MLRQAARDCNRRGSRGKQADGAHPAAENGGDR